MKVNSREFSFYERRLTMTIAMQELYSDEEWEQIEKEVDDELEKRGEFDDN